MIPLVLMQHPAAQMQPPPPPPPGGPVMHAPFLLAARELGLGEDQIARLKAIHRAHRDALETRQEALHEARKALMDAVQSGADLKALHAVFAQAHLAAMSEASALHAESLAVLTPAQQAKAKTLHPPRPEGRGPGMEGPGHQGPGGGPMRPPRPPREGE